jgi:hypothetical protein
MTRRGRSHENEIPSIGNAIIVVALALGMEVGGAVQEEEDEAELHNLIGVFQKLSSRHHKAAKIKNLHNLIRGPK